MSLTNEFTDGLFGKPPSGTPDFSSPPLSVLVRTLVQAGVACATLLGTAFGQSASLVRVASDATAITSRTHAKGDVLMTASSGLVLEVIDAEGDRYSHRPGNWYWVLLPPDPHGTRRAGWISGRDVESVSSAATLSGNGSQQGEATASSAGLDRGQPRPSQADLENELNARDAELRQRAASPAPTSNPAGSLGNTGDTPPISEVVLNFAFAKSALSDEAKAKLTTTVAMLKANPQGVSFAIEGHADSIGDEPFNERLGLARAEAVQRYLSQQHQIPLEKMSVISYGEDKPVASNATRKGRAQNRRVVVKVRA